MMSEEAACLDYHHETNNNDFSESANDSSSAIQVAVRVRPFSEKERLANSGSVFDTDTVKVYDHNSLVMTDTRHSGRGNHHQPKADRQFNFDQCFSSESKKDPTFASQQDIFDRIGKGVVTNAFEGYNCCVFAYGQTGSGKTHTMMGSDSENDEDLGLVPRICKALLERIREKRELKEDGGVKTLHSLSISYCEIYNEKVKDLLEAPQQDNNNDNSSSAESSILSPRSRTTLRVREHPQNGPFVEGLVTRSCGSYAEIESALAEGQLSRTVAETEMNPQSSRSHAIFTISFTQTTIESASLSAIEKTSKISLIDLAGSERADSTGARGERLKEASMINKSLSTLGRVISTLSNQNQHERVPYRDSILTWLLKECLGGNAKTTMIAMISPSSESYEESMSTLRYAESAKKVQNRAIVNEDPNAKILRQLKAEIEELRQELSKQASNAGITASLNEREKVLNELELIAGQEDNNVLSVELRQSVPSLVNLNENISAESRDESLVYYLSPGSNVFGSKNNQNDTKTSESSTTHCIAGAAVKDVHATITSTESNLVIFPHNASCEVRLNGSLIKDKTELHHRDRVSLGSHAGFRVHVPSIAAKHDSTTLESEDVDLNNLKIAVDEANSLCEKLQLGYKVKLHTPNSEDEDSSELSINVVLPEGQVSSVSWEPDTFFDRLLMLRNMSTLHDETKSILSLPNNNNVKPNDDHQNRHQQQQRSQSNASSSSSTNNSSASIVAGEIQTEDPFFEARANAVRLVGQARVYAGSNTSSANFTSVGSETKVPIIDSSGRNIGIVTLFIQPDLKKPKPAASYFLSPKGSSFSKNNTSTTCSVTISHLEFSSGIIVSEGLYVTYRQWNEKKSYSTEKGTSFQSNAFAFNTELKLKLKPSTVFVDEKDDSAHILLEIWGQGNLIEFTQEKEGAKPLSRKLSRRRSSVSIAAKIDVFVSVDIEEQGSDGVFRPVSVKDEGTLRLNSQSKSRRLQVRLTQADHLPFCLESIQQVRICLLGLVDSYHASRKTEAFENGSIANKQWVTLVMARQDIDNNSRTITCTVNCTSEDAAALFPLEKTKDGQRNVYRIALAFGSSKSSMPIVISKVIRTKLYNGSTSAKSSSSSSLRSKLTGAWWARESFSRTQHLGSWYTVELAKNTAKAQDGEQRISSNNLTQRLLDLHGKDVARRDAIMELDRQRQYILRSTADDVRTIKSSVLLSQYPSLLVEEQGQLYVKESNQTSGLKLHLINGTLSKDSCSSYHVTSEGTQLEDDLLHHASHIVTQPNNSFYLKAATEGSSSKPTTVTSTAVVNSSEVCGFLMIRNTSRASRLLPSHVSWTRRWLVLQSPLLHVYKSFSKKKEVEIIDISRCQISVHPSDAAAGFPFSFHLTNDSKMWHFQASTASELRAWLVAIDPLKIDARIACVENKEEFETSAPTA